MLFYLLSHGPTEQMFCETCPRTVPCGSTEPCGSPSLHDRPFLVADSSSVSAPPPARPEFSLHVPIKLHEDIPMPTAADREEHLNEGVYLSHGVLIAPVWRASRGPPEQLRRLRECGGFSSRAVPPALSARSLEAPVPRAPGVGGRG